MMKWWKIFAKKHKGFSMVELICAVAILSIVITGAGSAMVISARSYQRGNTELDLQQQAQITANLVTNLIIDADMVEEPSTETGGSLLSVRKIETETVTDEDGNTSQVAVNYRYMVTTDGADADNPKLVYTREKLQVDDTGAVVAVVSSETNTLAEHISAFTIKRVADNNIDFSLKVVSTTGKTFESDYHVTPRNGVSSSAGSALSGAKSVWVENELILEPNQTYDLNVRITGTSIQGYTIQGLTGNSSSDTNVSDTARITVGASETGSGPEAMFSFNVVPNDTSIASINVKVYVRRVNDINVTGSRTSGSVNKAGGYYKVTAPLLGTNLERKLGAWYDADYVNPYQISWSYEFTKEDEYGNITHPDYNEYIEIIGSPGIDGNNIPYVIFKLKQDMTSGCELKVIATALHPEGIKLQNDPEIWSNKSKVAYGHVQGSWILEYQAWRRNGVLDIGLHDTLGEEFFEWGIRQDEEGNNVEGNYFSSNAWVTITGYRHNNEQFYRGPVHYWNTVSTGGFMSYDYVSGGDPREWLVQMVVRDTDHPENPDRDWMSFSSPYIQYYNQYFGMWRDINRFEIDWHLVDKYGNETHRYETQTVEDVSILYRNSVRDDAAWNRKNIIYVTESDSIESYRVYFKFDRGWDYEQDQCRFDNTERFVGKIYDDEFSYENDVRRDISVTAPDVYTDQNSYVDFLLSTADKAECKAIAASYGGVIEEIYEYNPYLAKPCSIDGVSLERLWEVKGCKGTVEFHFVESNITGAALKTGYCPTPDEFTALGNVYYVSSPDTEIRIVGSGNSAIYQEVSGGAVTTVNLSWNGTGWTVY